MQVSVYEDNLISNLSCMDIYGIAQTDSDREPGETADCHRYSADTHFLTHIW